nr:TGS domain-containing protein [Actinomycetota bacterium]
MSNDIDITLPDGSSRRLAEGATGADLAASIGRGLAKAAIAATVDGTQVDLNAPLPTTATVSIVTTNSDEGRS